MALIITKGTDVKEKELEALQELKVESVLASEEEKALSALLGSLENIKSDFDAVLQGNSVLNPDVPFKEDNQGFNLASDFAYSIRRNVNYVSPLTAEFVEIAEALNGLSVKVKDFFQRLSKMASRAEGVANLMLSIERGELSPAPSFLQKGKGVIERMAGLNYKERDDIIDKIYFLRSTHSVLVSVILQIGEAQKFIRDFIRQLQSFKNNIQKGRYDSVADYLKIYEDVKGLRMCLDRVHRLFSDIIPLLKSLFLSMDGFKVWLNNHYHLDQPVSQFQGSIQEADSIVRGNLSLMQSFQNGGMRKALSWLTRINGTDYVHFFFDRATGEIKYFGFDSPAGIAMGFSRGLFAVSSGVKLKILGIYSDYGRRMPLSAVSKGYISEFAQKVLLRTIALFNRAEQGRY